MTSEPTPAVWVSSRSSFLGTKVPSTPSFVFPHAGLKIPGPRPAESPRSCAFPSSAKIAAPKGGSGFSFGSWSRAHCSAFHLRSVCMSRPKRTRARCTRLVPISSPPKLPWMFKRWAASASDRDLCSASARRRSAWIEKSSRPRRRTRSRGGKPARRPGLGSEEGGFTEARYKCRHLGVAAVRGQGELTERMGIKAGLKQSLANLMNCIERELLMFLKREGMPLAFEASHGVESRGHEGE
jgi:hypothetical protein